MPVSELDVQHAAVDAPLAAAFGRRPLECGPIHGIEAAAGEVAVKPAIGEEEQVDRFETADGHPQRDEEPDRLAAGERRFRHLFPWTGGRGILETEANQHRLGRGAYLSNAFGSEATATASAACGPSEKP